MILSETRSRVAPIVLRMCECATARLARVSESVHRGEGYRGIVLQQVRNNCKLVSAISRSMSANCSTGW